MVKKTSILLYEKEIKLNLILKEQISKSDLYDVSIIINQKKLIEFLKLIKPNVLILNLNDFNSELKNIITNYKLENKDSNILAYYNSNYPHFIIDDVAIKILKKPFKILNLLEELEKLQNSKSSQKKDIFLMNHLKFLPRERVLFNLKTKNKEHLTEKENQLLFYFYANKNIEITRNVLLNIIWGLSETINTHTLETHIYRLKLKLNKLEPNLSFSLSNQNGLYLMKFDTIRIK